MNDLTWWNCWSVIISNKMLTTSIYKSFRTFFLCVRVHINGIYQVPRTYFYYHQTTCNSITWTVCHCYGSLITHNQTNTKPYRNSMFKILGSWLYQQAVHFNLITSALFLDNSKYSICKKHHGKINISQKTGTWQALSFTLWGFT